MSEYLLIIVLLLETLRIVYQLLKQGTQLSNNLARPKNYKSNLKILQYSSSALELIENYVRTLVFKLLIWFNYDSFNLLNCAD